MTRRISNRTASLVVRPSMASGPGRVWGLGAGAIRAASGTPVSGVSSGVGSVIETSTGPGLGRAILIVWRLGSLAEYGLGGLIFARVA